MNPIISGFLQVITAAKDTLQARSAPEAMLVDEPASSPSTLGSVPETVTSSEKSSSDVITPSVEEEEEELPWWIENWPSLKRTRMNDGSWNSNSTFSAEPIFEQISAVTRVIEEDITYSLPPEIRNYFQNVSTGPDGEYVESKPQNSSQRRQGAARRRIPRPPAPPTRPSASRPTRPFPKSSHKRSSEGSSMDLDENWDGSSDLSDLSDIPRWQWPDDMSDLTELSDDEDDGGPNHRLIGHLPRAEKSAAKTYKEIPNNIYTTKHLGSVHFPPGARFCTCKYKEGDDLSLACGPRCVNRSCYIECVEEECRLGEVCQNQRLARKQFAPVEVVRTKWKGFGLRAAAPIPQDSLVYEYLGEVVTEAKLLRRMEKYARSGLKHIYLMQLQKGEYIDATRKGGIGRFANHSCNPNCDIQQWTVGDRLRMAIVAKRDIELNEELTFNYNVDHYGNDAQECHCGESNCTGTIGGTTQTVLSDDSSTDGEDNEAPPKVTKKPGRPRLKSRASSGSSRTNAEKAASPKSTHSSPSESRATRSMTRIPKQGNRSGTRLQKKK